MITEKQLVEQISQYLQYKKIIYRFDYAADVRLTIGQAVRMKKIQGEKKGFPDLYVFLKGGKTIFFELKKSKSEVYKKNGSFKQNEHLREQLKYHKTLKDLGFDTRFIWSFEMFIDILKLYTGDKK